MNEPVYVIGQSHCDTFWQLLSRLNAARGFARVFAQKAFDDHCDHCPACQKWAVTIPPEYANLDNIGAVKAPGG